MIIKKDASDLKKVFKLVKLATPSHFPVMPIAESFLFRVREDEVTITGTDLEVSISNSFTNDEPSFDDYSFLVNGKLITDLVETLSGQLEFKYEESSQSLHIKSIHGRYRLSTMHTDEFPEIPSTDDFKEKEAITLKGSEIISSFKKTVYACNRKDAEVRPNLAGICFDVAEDTFNIVATDGHKLSLVNATSQIIARDTKVVRQYLIPAKAVDILTKILPDEDIVISFSKNYLLFTSDSFVFTGRLINQNYVNYKGVIPDINDAEMIVKVSKGQVISALKRISNFYEKNELSKAVFDFLNEKLTIYCESEIGEVKEYIQIDEIISFKEMKIGFNSKLLLDTLETIEEPDIIFYFYTPAKSALIYPDGNDKHISLAMPMRV